jgi:hypothetical protein
VVKVTEAKRSGESYDRKLVTKFSQEMNVVFSDQKIFAALL